MNILSEHDWYDHWIPQYLNDGTCLEYFNEAKVIERKERISTIHISQDSVENRRIGNLIGIKEYYNQSKVTDHSESF